MGNLNLDAAMNARIDPMTPVLPGRYHVPSLAGKLAGVSLSGATMRGRPANEYPLIGHTSGHSINGLDRLVLVVLVGARELLRAVVIGVLLVAAADCHHIGVVLFCERRRVLPELAPTVQVPILQDRRLPMCIISQHDLARPHGETRADVCIAKMNRQRRAVSPDPPD